MAPIIENPNEGRNEMQTNNAAPQNSQATQHNHSANTGQATLSPQQRRQLIDKINELPLKTISRYFLLGVITFEDVPHISEERKRYIEEILRTAPNPKEQEEWAEIQKLLPLPETTTIDMMQVVQNKLANYISRWETSRPNGNHVDEARASYQELKKRIEDTIIIIEDSDWKQVDMFSKDSLLNHLRKYPQSAHRGEIDDSVWNLVNQESEQDIRDYLNAFPNGNHCVEAHELHHAMVSWYDVKNSNDIFTVNQYLQENPNTPYKFQAQTMLISLKQSEIKQMLSDTIPYDETRLRRILNEGVMTENELINHKAATKNIIDIIKDGTTISNLPDIRQAINDSEPECKEGYTDVYFFGVPATGKTCVLMGLSRSDSLHINLAAGGGDYASALQQFTDAGVCVPGTPGTFVTTLEATISSHASNGIVHKINLVEMSGEEFAFGIANNPDHQYSFEDMGTGATELLRNNNRKVFFLIIDPTANVVRINREIVDRYDEITGQPAESHLVSAVSNQRVLIQKIVNIFENPENADIMKKVDSIHIIMTKSDTLGNAVVREERALEIFNNKFGHHIIDPLKNICKEYNINTATNFCPKLYTFSLGTFYLGSRYYEYEQTDSNRLVRAIRNSTQGAKPKTWWDRLKEALN